MCYIKKREGMGGISIIKRKKKIVKKFLQGLPYCENFQSLYYINPST